MESIPLNDIYQHKLNFLIGAGASNGLFPTLWLSLKNSDDNTKEETIETLATKLDQAGERKLHTLLFMHYYQKIIEPVCKFKINDLLVEDITFLNDVPKCKKKEVIDNYEKFIDSIIRLLQQKSDFSKRCNLFTTNYDGCIPLVADKLIKKGNLDFCINDGSNGFLEKILAAKNFNNYVCKSGVFGKHVSDLPQINLINMHGSAYWRKYEDDIIVDYSLTETEVVIPEVAGLYIQQLESILNDHKKNTDDVLNLEIILEDDVIDIFWEAYNKLPIVNPTKWKFHETVFEEHYYQMLRLLSYQLEEPNSILISFAFSFADEHILKLIERSLSNPKLKVFVCCFNEQEKHSMEKKFNGYRNVELISLKDENLDFEKFNEVVFNADALRDQENED